MKNPIGSLLRPAGYSLGLGLLSVTGLLAPRLSAADVSINVSVDAPPPPPRHEVIVGVRPGPDYVWTAGYWDGSPGHYVWVGGHWDRPPHPHAVWSAPHWEKGNDGHYRQVKGEWRDH